MRLGLCLRDFYLLHINLSIEVKVIDKINVCQTDVILFLYSIGMILKFDT